jgi:hypothetical protein
MAFIAALGALTACEKKAPGTYEVEKPVIGTQTDTIHTPTVDMKMQKETVSVPKIEVKKP